MRRVAEFLLRNLKHPFGPEEERKRYLYLNLMALFEAHDKAGLPSVRIGPVFADLHVYFEEDVEVEGGGHDAEDELAQAVEL